MSIKMHNITQSYSELGKSVLDNLSLEVKNGKFTVLIGGNGVGKSTLIKCILNLVEYDGTIKIDEYDNSLLDAKKRIAYCPEVPQLYEYLTTQEQADFIINLNNTKKTQKDIDYLYNLLNLNKYKNTLIKDLSKGTKQKISILLTLLKDTNTIVFDEPLVGLDRESIDNFTKQIKILKDKGCCIFISTHVIEDFKDVLDNICLLENGQIKDYGTRKASIEVLKKLDFVK